MTIRDIPTPAYVCEQWRLDENLKILKNIAQKSGAKIYCALKGFAFSPAMPVVSAVLDGATSSGLWETRYAHAAGFKNICTYSPAFKDDEIDEILQKSTSVIFNSLNQLQLYAPKARQMGVPVGLRLNPQTSASPTDMYNPCAPHSRLGVTADMLKNAGHGATKTLMAALDGVHFHALCEESAQSLQMVLNAVESQFEGLLKSVKWVNFGGGHHITKAGYDTELLIKLIKDFRAKYGCEVILEPGEAVGWQAGFLVASVLDIVDNGGVKTAIIDASAECHMPDTILMPYRPAVRGEVCGGELGDCAAAASHGSADCDAATSSEPASAAASTKNAAQNPAASTKNAAKTPASDSAKYPYRLAGATCLAGDIVGLAAGAPTYYFAAPLKAGDRVIFEDQLHYTIVKNTTFNGTRLPLLAVMQKDGQITIKREFDSTAYSGRN